MGIELTMWSTLDLPLESFEVEAVGAALAGVTIFPVFEVIANVFPMSFWSITNFMLRPFIPFVQELLDSLGAVGEVTLTS